MAQIKKKYKIKRDIMSSAGMLYKDTKVRVLEIKEGKEFKKRITVEDMMGRIFYVNEGDITN